MTRDFKRCDQEIVIIQSETVHEQEEDVERGKKLCVFEDEGDGKVLIICRTQRVIQEAHYQEVH